MDKLERRLARLWRRMRGEKRRERRSKKGESSPQSNRGEVVTSNNKQRYENNNDLKDLTPRRNHSKHEEKDLDFKLPRRSHSKHDEKDKKLALRRSQSKHDEKDVKEAAIRRNHSNHVKEDPKSAISNRSDSREAIQKELTSRPDHSKMEESVAPSRTQRHPPEDISLALIRLYAFARLKSLQKTIVAGSTSLKSYVPSTPAHHDNLESFKPLERLSFLSSLPQLSPYRFESKDFDKVSSCELVVVYTIRTLL
ncbi:unnamed protein product [Strongylus vulgaris]|uniref:Uncharacterized protein n=1 Tax=Strongylus vulgaris TaxID=40348 RepID=A0A3P7K8E8_STRVU|nr:unnamed protein product [Strongylus vulgaris]